MILEKAVWYAYPDFRPPLNTVVLVRTLRRGNYDITVARYDEDSFGNGEFFHPLYRDRFPKTYPDDFMLLDLYALPERR